MRPLAIFAVWLTVGFVATGLLAGTLERILVPTETKAEAAAAYVPPSAAPSQFLANLQQRSDANR